jgi:hypothetical protein
MAGHVLFDYGDQGIETVIGFGQALSNCPYNGVAVLVQRSQLSDNTGELAHIIRVFAVLLLYQLLLRSYNFLLVPHYALLLADQLFQDFDVGGKLSLLIYYKFHLAIGFFHGQPFRKAPRL